MIMDKGYQGTAEVVRAITAKKMPQNRVIHADNERTNRRIASDRIVVENVFGRVEFLWNIESSKWRWAENNYDVVFCLCVELTNLYITWHPLLEEDYDHSQ